MEGSIIIIIWKKNNVVGDSNHLQFEFIGKNIMMVENKKEFRRNIWALYFNRVVNVSGNNRCCAHSTNKRVISCCN